MPIERELLGKAIRRLRQLRGMSQAKLGEEADLRGNSVALIERGQRGVSIETLNQLADALDIPAACLTMLGMTTFAGLSESGRLVKSMQKLIIATVAAEERLQAKEAKKAARRTGGKTKKRAQRSVSTKSRVRSA